MKSTMKRALSLVLTALMLLMLLPGGMAEEMNTASAPVIPGLSDGGALVSEVLGESAEKTAAELLYDRLMACETIDEINAMLDGLTEEESALLDQFTDEQNAALEAKVEELGGYGTEINKDLYVTVNFSSAEVAYVNFTSGDNVNNIKFTTISNGEQFYQNKDSGVTIFFIKPAENYLLTTYSSQDSTQKHDLYGINIPASRSNINYLTTATNAQELLDKADGLGYVGYFGFTNSYASGTHVFTIHAQQPKMAVSVEVTPNTNVKPGDELTYIITIFPGQLTGVSSRVTGKRITELKINNVVIAKENIVQNEDGTYSVNYTVSEGDWLSNKLHLDVTAELDYEYTLGVSDSQGVDSKISTTTTILATGGCDPIFATKKGVVYQVNFNPADKADDVTGFGEIPVDEKEYFENNEVTVDSDYGKTPVDDPTNGGTWTFDGWYNGTEKVGDTLTMGTSNILLVGTWTFTPYPNTTVTITKNVTGNMGDWYKEFSFTVEVKDKSGNAVTDYTMTDVTDSANSRKVETLENSFTFKKGTKYEIGNVPIGGTVTITETPDGYDASATINNTSAGEKLSNGDFQVTYSNVAEGTTITFTNSKTATPDTGVLLDSLPYLLILAVVVIVIVLSIVRKRRNDD